MKKLFGVAINDTDISGPSSIRLDGRKVIFPDYATWYNMLTRCFDEKTKARIPSVIGSTCCEEWLTRSSFQNWYFMHSIFCDNSGKTLCLDKDILVKGNKEYSPTRCALVPSYLNSLMNEGSPSYLSQLFWVNKIEDRYLSKPYRCVVSVKGEKSAYCGYFHTPQEAHAEGQLRKYENIKYFVEHRYKKEKCYRDDVAASLLCRAEKLLEDHSMGVVTSSF